MQNEMIFSDLGTLCTPKENISDKRIKDKWCSYYYETGTFKGNMLLSVKKGVPKEVELNPSLRGWHKIYVGLYSPGYEQTEIELKLSSDSAFMRLSTALNRGFGEHSVEEVFWKYAELDGESIVIGKHVSFAADKTAAITWLRFERMTDEEIRKYHAEKERTDTKRIYATNDMHVMLCMYDMSRKNAWKTVVEDYIDSDVEWLAIENISHVSSKISDCEPDDFTFGREIDKAFYEQWEKNYTYDVLKDIVSYGKSKGIKMCVSWRICQWRAEFPFDRIHFEQEFAKSNPQLRCVDRDGDVTEYMSFMYPEVQDYVINEFVKMSQTGCDAVQVLFSRGWPYILFEKPFLDKFYDRYKEDARLLPIDDERIIELKSEIMTNFMRKLRSKLDNSVELHAKVLFSLYDCSIMGLDVEEWAKERLVQRIVSDERRIREVLPKELFIDGKIDLEKYTKYAKENTEPAVRYDYDYIFEPFEDSNGILRGPRNQEERISGFMKLEKYGMTVYIEIMPRIMSIEKIKEKALEIYEAGCEHIGLWDTYSRVNRKLEWNMWKRIGHKEELKDFNNDGFYKKVRIIKIGDKNVRSYKPMWGC